MDDGHTTDIHTYIYIYTGYIMDIQGIYKGKKWGNGETRTGQVGG